MKFYDKKFILYLNRNKLKWKYFQLMNSRTNEFFSPQNWIKILLIEAEQGSKRIKKNT